LDEIFGGSWGGIGIYGDENAIWTLLNRRKTSKKDEFCAPFDHFCTVFLQKRAAFDHFFTLFYTKIVV
jgi:hypothetical protein